MKDLRSAKLGRQESRYFLDFKEEMNAIESILARILELGEGPVRLNEKAVGAISLALADMRLEAMQVLSEGSDGTDDRDMVMNVIKALTSTTVSVHTRDGVIGLGPLKDYLYNLMDVYYTAEVSEALLERMSDRIITREHLGDGVVAVVFGMKSREFEYEVLQEQLKALTKRVEIIETMITYGEPTPYTRDMLDLLDEMKKVLPTDKGKKEPWNNPKPKKMK